MVDNVAVHPIWSTKMTGKDPIVSVTGMKRLLRWSLGDRHFDVPRDFLDPYRRAIQEAEAACDGQLFKELRNRVFDQVEIYIARQRMETGCRLWGSMDLTYSRLG